MNEAQFMEQIHSVVGSAIKDAFKELGIENKVKSAGINSFKKTEQVLWNYAAFHDLLKVKEDQIREVLENGIPEKSKSILEYQPSGNWSSGLETTDEQIAEIVQGIQDEIKWIEGVLYKIDTALNAIRSDPNYFLIERYYFKGERISDLANELKIDQPLLTMRKNKLVRQMAMHLFPKETIGEYVEGIA